jgi:hypothetical protein
MRAEERAGEEAARRKMGREVVRVMLLRFSPLSSLLFRLGELKWR